MTLTLLQAKNALADYAANGICPTDNRFIPTLNEAQERLIPHGPFLGTLAKYSVKCSTDSGGVAKYFDTPDPIENVSRVTNFVDKFSTATVDGAFLTDTVAAWVHPGQDVIPVYNGYSPRRYFVPEDTDAVEVVGTKVYTPVALDTDLLYISDIPALKLMLLALWRERNDKLDLAATLEQKAIERLRMVTDKAVDEARRINYQGFRFKFSYGTVGWVRAKLVSDLRGGINRDDGMIMDLLNKAQDLLIARYNFFILQNRLGVKDNLPKLGFTPLIDDTTCLPIPDYQQIKLIVLSLLGTNAGDPTAAQAIAALEQQAYDLLERDLRSQLLESRRTNHEADFAMFRDQPRTFGYFRTRIALDLPDDAGLMMTDDELSRKINEAEEWIMMNGRFKGAKRPYSFTIDASGQVLLPLCIESVLAASIGGRFAPVWANEADYHQNGQGYSIGEFPGIGNRMIHRGEKNGRALYYVKDACTPDCVHVLVTLRFIVHVDDTEDMIVVNYPAIKAVVESFITADPNVSMLKQKLALGLLEGQLRQNQGHDRMTLQVQNVGSFGNIPAIV